MALHVSGHFVSELFHEERTLRARAHDAHVAQEHVDELGDLVYGEAS